MKTPLESMKTPLASIVCFTIASVLGATGQFFYKSGAVRAGGGLSSYFLNPRLLAGVVCYAGVMVLFIVAFKRGGELSVLYPIYASTFIFSAIGARVLYGELIHPANYAGMALLVAGMCLMGWKPL
jgi:multidrug transporter EmrE-like cation transporter